LAREEGLTKSTLVLFLPTPFLKVCCTRELEADALEKAALGFDANLFILPVVSQDCFAIPLYLKESKGVIVMFRKLEPSCHEVGPGFNYLAHGATMILT